MRKWKGQNIAPIWDIKQTISKEVRQFKIDSETEKNLSKLSQSQCGNIFGKKQDIEILTRCGNEKA